MKPLICFYENEHYIYSTDYTLHTCAPNQSITNFLQKIENEYNKNLKIVQINFEYENEINFLNQIDLYPSHKASVLILNTYELITEKKLLEISQSDIPSTLNFKLLESEEIFKNKIQKIKTEISQGRIYQVNLTAPLICETIAASQDIFNIYYKKFNGSYKALIPLTEFDLISFSPELFLKKNGPELITRPIKGSATENIDFETALIKNLKEEAELSMIVDLLRNDFNRIENNNSALVTAHRKALSLGYIQHTYSEIKINTNKSLAEILTATLPGGSISGCPKTESLMVITELEKYKRQAYTGTHGWWKENNFCLSLTIRSFMKYKNELFYHAGCGIVFDSDPEKEWQEFLMKTGSLNLLK